MAANPDTSAVPEEVIAALHNVPDEDSESEDTSDEAFLRRHKEMESTEQERHMVVVGPQKKHKSDSKVSPATKKVPPKGMNDGQVLGTVFQYPGQAFAGIELKQEPSFGKERFTPALAHHGMGGMPSSFAVYYDESGARARGRAGRKAGRPRGRPPHQVGGPSSGV